MRHLQLNILPWERNASYEAIIENFKRTLEGGGHTTSLEIKTEEGLIFLKEVKSIKNSGGGIIVFRCTCWYAGAENKNIPVEVMMNTSTGHGYIIDLSSTKTNLQFFNNPPDSWR